MLEDNADFVILLCELKPSGQPITQIWQINLMLIPVTLGNALSAN